MAIRLDRVLMSSLHESFKNYSTVKETIEVSGSIPGAFVGKDFYIDIPYDRQGTIADIYVSKQGSGRKRLATYAWELPEFVGTVDIAGAIYVNYFPTFIRVNISISNGGATASVTTQNFDIEAVIFDAPISN